MGSAFVTACTACSCVQLGGGAVGFLQQHLSQAGTCRGAALLWKRAKLPPWCVRSSNTCVCPGAVLLCHCDSLVLCGGYL